eukprot:2490849-Rhodomonas_salina.1
MSLCLDASLRLFVSFSLSLSLSAPSPPTPSIPAFSVHLTHGSLGQLLLFVNDWGITFGGWNEIGSQTVTELPAGESGRLLLTNARFAVSIC